MPDLISYCPDTAALIAELQATAPELVHLDEASGEARLLVDKTVTVRNGAETLALLRNPPAALAGLASLTLLGTYDEVLADPAKAAIYDRVYPRTPLTFTDEFGNEVTVTPPERIGEFA